MKDSEVAVTPDRYQYDQAFFDAQSTGSLASARAVVPLVQAWLQPSSVLDVGCGIGTWVAAWRDAGIHDAEGVDGGYVKTDRLLLDPARFHPIDITHPFRLARTFALVQCLEVAEHLPCAAASTLVDNLAAHAPMVLFSAASPGQGGENHINEQPPEFWRGLFRERGYELFDFFRHQLAGRRDVEPWYRYNTLLFVRRDGIDALPPALKDARVADDQAIADISPFLYQVRKRVLSCLSPATVTRLARGKGRLVVMKARARAGLGS